MAFSAPASADVRPVPWAPMTAEALTAAAQRLDLEPMPAFAPPKRGAVALAAGDLAKADHDAVPVGLMTGDRQFRNAMSGPLAAALAAASAESAAGALSDGAPAGATRVDVASAGTLLRCVNRFAYATRCIVTVDLADTATPPGGEPRRIFATAEHGAAAAGGEKVAEVIRLVSEAAMGAFVARASGAP